MSENEHDEELVDAVYAVEEIEHLRSRVAEMGEEIARLLAEVAQKDERITELETALVPFSKIIIEAGAIQEVYIRTSDILAARAALAGDAPKPIMVRCVDAKRRIDALEDALRPFARMADFFGDCDGPKKLILVGIFRYQADQARAALEGDAPKED